MRGCWIAIAVLALYGCRDAPSPPSALAIHDQRAAANASVTVLTGLDGVTPTAINDSDEVVGNTSDNAAFSWTASAGMKMLSTAGATLTNAFDVNDNGIIVGAIGNVDSVRAAVWLPSGSVRALQSPADSTLLEPQFSCVAYGVNLYGAIAGSCEALSLYYFPTTFNWHGPANDQSPNAGGQYSGVSDDGWLAGASRSDNFNQPGAFIVSPTGDLIRLRTHGGGISPISSVAAITRHGWAAGTDSAAGCVQAVAWLSAPQQQYPEFRMGTCGAATGLTNDWYVVGTGTDAAQTPTSQWAFVWYPGAGLERLPGLGTTGEYSTAIAINSQHHILGQITSNGVTHTVIWKMNP
jgi:hypothetical protein